MENSTGLYECPECKMPLLFSHPEMDIIQCAHCRTFAMRKEGVIFKKTFLPITDGNHLIQIGTTGLYNGLLFTVKGRFRLWLEDSIYNYWTIIFDDFTIAYLAEGYGLYAIHQKAKQQADYFSQQSESRQVGIVRTFAGEDYLMLRSENCIKWEVEGEVAMPYSDNEMRLSDFVNKKGENIELIQYFGTYIVAYEVSATSFADLQLKQLNTLGTEDKTVKCHECGRPTVLKAYPFTHSYSCYGCGTRYALDNSTNFAKCGKDHLNQNNPLLPLGKKGNINGIEYEVIGYAHKEEMNQYKSRWKEYTLYNRAEGFAFLSEYNGHWMYVRETLQTPVLMEKKTTGSFLHEGNYFELFNNYKYKLLDSLGEFPYNAFDVYNIDVKEYISPPEMWIQEAGNKEGISWFHGSYIDGSLIGTAFQISAPYKSGVGAAEPKSNISPRKLLQITTVLVCAMLVIHLILGYTKQNRVVMDNNYSFGDSATTVSYVTEKFHLDKWRSNVEIEIGSPVANSWLEVDGTLVNADNGTEYSFEEGVEYYSGYTDGESWTEGDQHGSVYLNSIPKGNYFFQIQGVRSPTDANRTSSFSIAATYDTQQHKNIILLILLLLLWPLIKYCIIINSERKRWADSPFDPYQSTRPQS